ncbi:MAG TPA: DUF3108 domain-containing protein [Terriglobales bacterium]|nr:DUF3108 domain-containing protein [Terriglobales bacterium]
MSRRIFPVLLVFFAILAAAAAFVWLHVRSQQPVVAFTPQPKAPAGAASPPPPNSSLPSKAPPAPPPEKPLAEPVFVPRAGEVLDFSADVAKVNDVATLRLEVGGKTELRGKDVWHFQAAAHTQNPLRMVFALDDQFDSYSDSGSFVSMQYEMRLDERGQKVDSVQRMSTTAKEPAPPGASIARVLPGTRDPLGFMQYLRSVDWSKTSEVHSPVYDGRKLYEVRAERTGTAKVKVAAGDFSTNAIEIRVFENGAEMKDAHFTLYLSRDAARTPVLLEAVLPFATARVELVKRAE